MKERIDIRKLRSIPNDQRTVNRGANKWWDFLNRDISIGRRIMSDSVKGAFYMELASLLEAGVNIRTALELINEEQDKNKFKILISQILESIIEGYSLSGALKRSRKFSDYEYFSIQIGEETGKLVIVLKELARYFTKRTEQRRQIISALTYPIIVLVVAFGAVTFMITFVVPMFTDTFKRFGSDLPAITKAVISGSALLRKLILPLLLISSGIILLLVWQRKQLWLRKLSSAFLLRIPVFGRLLQKIYLSRFCNTMSLLISAKTPMVQAIELVNQMISFYPMEESLHTIRKDIIGGAALNRSMAAHSIYPKKMVAIVRVGEEVNQLESFFSRLANQYAAEVEHQTTMLAKFLEPLIIIVLGLTVGFILVAMYLPMFELGQTI